MDLMTGLAAAGQALEIAKKLREFDKELKNAEFKLQIADLYTNLAEVKIALADAQTALQAKDAEIAELKAVKALKMQTVEVGGFNYGIAKDGSVLKKPFCPICEQAGGFQIPISNGLRGHDLCPKCNGVFDARKTNLPSGYTLAKS